MSRGEGACQERGLDFLEGSQDPKGHPDAGAWAAERLRAGRLEAPDRTCFVTALTVLQLAALPASPRIGAMVRAGRRFIETCAAGPAVGGSARAYGFWRNDDVERQNRPDLDDTALALLALGAPSQPAAKILSETDALALFSPYRVHAGCPLAAQSRWAAAFSGVFGTWAASTGAGAAAPVLVDAGVNANVLRCLAVNDHRTAPGFAAASRMLASVLSSDLNASVLAPYYRSHALLVWLAAEAARACGDAGRQLAAAVEGALRRLRRDPRRPCGEILFFAAARAALGLAAGLTPGWLAAMQLADGGWPPAQVCADAMGRHVWRSRAVSTALAIRLVDVEAGEAQC
jgi:hypothetical protein